MLLMKKLFLLCLSTLLFAETGILEKIESADSLLLTRKGKSYHCEIAFVKMLKKESPCKNKAAYEALQNHAIKLLKEGSEYAYRISNPIGKERGECEFQLAEYRTYNLQLIKDGFALADSKNMPVMYKRKYLPAMNKAIRDNEGLWKNHSDMMECLR